MAESSYQNPYLSSSSSRLGGGLRKNKAPSVVGEIVEVEGGHIVRSTGRKDRHSKVCTAKGPRDRRVRLAAHTAIQFYDVQDRLGYDRPSKAVDWLMKKAKAAIDELAELPAWQPTATNISFEPESAQRKLEDEDLQQHNIQHHHQADLMVSGSWGRRAMPMFGGGENEQISRFLPPSLDSDVIANTIKSFFPIGGAGSADGETSSSAMQFHNNNIQDLRLSLQSFQDPNFLRHHHTPPPPHANPSYHHSEQQARAQGQPVLLSGTPLGFDSWTTQPDHPWNSGGDSSGGFMFNSPTSGQQVFGGNPNQFITTSQRGPLQSSNTPSIIRAWMDPPSAISINMADQHHHHPGAFPAGGIGFASGYGGFCSTGFNIPARIQGDEEEHDGYSDKPSSASSGSRH